ncbi:MAG: UDP-3-O-(3-hydroxymyristoyl)glucosamine N-acyltransferase [Deltaproteobacteria bacterium]|nr:MAG: UDP-3-O-(3-hydroxymyristoyl)glucosamine N-acyltransferase [Deltaproteobacteria bacterium]
MELTLRHIAESVGGAIVGDDQVSIKGINSLPLAEKGEMSFLADPRLKDQIRVTKASAVIVREFSGLYQGPQLIVSDPYLAYARVAAMFAPPIPRFPGISEKAIIGKGTHIGKDVSIYPFVWVGRESVIGNGVILFPGVYVGDRATVGDGSVIYPSVTIMSDCIIGKQVIIHAGTVIGSDGFGYARDGDISVKIPQTGIVQIEDDVEIGANNAIDRAAFGKTVIRKGVKTDNLVQIGHNVVIGENTIIVAQVGIAGSTTIGKCVVIGGQVGLTDHIAIGDRVMIGSKSGVAKSIPADEVVSGIPTMPHRLWLRTRGHIRRLPEYSDRLKELENRVKELEEQLRKESRG